MKTIKLSAALLCSIFAINLSFAQPALTDETIKVWGNCGMCKTTIEKAAKKAGAVKANWNKDSKELKVSYATEKTSGNKIQESIAKAGYDTQDLLGDNAAYKKLPACCHYDRKTAMVMETAGAKTYTCPMHPNVVSDKMGKCPSCGMDLVEAAAKTYTCPMHPSVVSDKMGKCPSCGMDLVEKKTKSKN